MREARELVFTGGGQASIEHQAGRGGRRLPASASVVVENPLGGVVEIVELAALDRAKEEPGEDTADQQCGWEQNEEGAHQSPWRTSRSTLVAFQITTMLDSGMSTAATSGFTSPATAAATATRL